MRVISIDDEQLILDDFVEMLESMEEIDSVHGFTDCEAALSFIKENEVDVAFCDIHMRGMDMGNRPHITQSYQSTVP